MTSAIATASALIESCSLQGAGASAGAAAPPATQRFDVHCPAGSRAVVQQRENLPPLVSCSDSATAVRRDSTS